jgi:hypothetical protein
MLALRTFSFEGAHPALAAQHYLRTLEQNEAIRDVQVGGGHGSRLQVLARAADCGLRDAAC